MSDSSLSPAFASHAKFVAARNSLIATVALVAAKLIVGLMTGSLGLLAEAIHSGLDLIVSFLTLFAVRFSARPPDADHPYGHGKIENLAAFIQCVVLLITCGWIVYEAVQRLIHDSVDVTVSFWAYAVVVGSIVIDFTRARVLRRVSQDTGSQALAADALNFETDIFSSVTVLIGLVLVTLSDVTGVGWLARGDAVAALIVAALIAWLSVRLLRETLTALLDGAHVPLTEDLRQAALAVPGVVSVRRVRTRTSGAVTFVDLVLTTSRLAQFDATHDVSERVEQAVRALIPNADVMVHVEPEALPD
ncbi:MAG: cation diffusion facilitator family transporter, partial [Dehalococcoidia bacterium]|nr:cation diffusion facilitator family transporter [Dehalococcoidia bacterium]